MQYNNTLSYYNSYADEFYKSTVNIDFTIVIDDDELIRYSKNWHKPAVSKDLAKYDNLEDDDTKGLLH